MKQFVKRIILMVAIFIFAGMAVSGLSMRAEAAERDADETEVLAQVVVPREEVFAAVTYSAGNGIVTGSGVRLRKEPNKTATILELMNNGELVNIILSDTTTKWYHLRRIKTGTKGYASKDYIFQFD